MIVDMAVYEHGVRRADELELEDAYEACRIDGSFAWIGLYKPTPEELEAVRREFNLHEVAIEDAQVGHQRPKVEVYGESLFVVLKPASYDEEAEAVETGEVQLFIGDGFVITVRHDETDLHSVRLELERRPDLLRHGPAAVLYGVLDKVVDDYFPVIEAVDEDIAEVEADVFSPARSNPAERIYKLKREALELHDAVAPLEEPLEAIVNGSLPRVPADLRPFFQDVLDHVVKAIRALDGFRDMLTSVLTANLTQISVRQNEDTRKISAWAAIIAVPTLVSGVYGMNFDHMPELGWRFGYPLALAVMAAVCLVLYRTFRRAGWL
ncbi:MAG TPA: magnesium/cobalt transporter CorA [Gaiellaceae bacterium]|nr:magnesium/cobalt transporter CorA [Gaiellaceae bacterium]